MRLPSLLLALLMLSPTVAMAQQFTSPANNATYSLTSNIGFTASGVRNDEWHTVRVVQGGVTLQEVAIPPSGSHSIGGTLNAPSGGWPAGNAQLKLFNRSNNELDSVDITFQ